MNYLDPRVPLVDAEYWRFWKGSMPSIGSFVVLLYHDKKTGEIVYHVARVSDFDGGFGIDESHFNGDTLGHRTLAFNDPAIIKFITL